MSGRITMMFGAGEKHKEISYKAFGSNKAFYKSDFGFHQDTKRINQGHFDLNANYGNIIGNINLFYPSKLPEIPESEKFIFDKWVSNLMEKEKTRYGRFELSEERKNYQQSKATKLEVEENDWYGFRHLPVQKSIKVIGRAVIKPFEPKLYDE